MNNTEMAIGLANSVIMAADEIRPQIIDGVVRVDVILDHMQKLKAEAKMLKWALEGRTAE